MNSLEPVSLKGLLECSAPVSYFLAFCFLVATYLFLHRFFYLHRVEIDPKGFLDGIKNSINSGARGKKEWRKEAVSACEDEFFKSHSPVASVAKGILCCRNQEAFPQQHAAEEVMLRELPRLQRHIGLIAAIGRLGPLLGFLGTVFALVKMFRKIAADGTGISLSVTEMAPAIESALITTAMGIAVAMVVVAYNAILEEKCRQIVNDMELASFELIAYLNISGNEDGDLVNGIPQGTASAEPVEKTPDRPREDVPMQKEQG